MRDTLFTNLPTQSQTPEQLLNYTRELQSLSPKNGLSLLPQHLDLMFGDAITTYGWFGHCHSLMVSSPLEPSTHHYLNTLMQLIGPESLMARSILWGDIPSKFNLETQQLPYWLRNTLKHKSEGMARLPSNHFHTLEGRKETLDFRKLSLTLNPQQWFLYVLVNNVVSSQPKTSEVPPELDNFYFDQSRSPYFTLLRIYLHHFQMHNPLLLKRLLQIIKEYTLDEYIYLAQETQEIRMSVFPSVQRQNTLYMMYLLIYYDRESIPREDMLLFFRFYLNESGQEGAAFDCCSLVRVWVYYIRPFDEAENSVVRLLIQVDSCSSLSQRHNYLQLVAYPPEAVLSPAEVNSEYYSIIKSNIQLHLHLLNQAVTALSTKSISPRTVYMLTVLSCLFTGPYCSSILTILDQNNHQYPSLLRGGDYVCASRALTSTCQKLDRLAQRRGDQIRVSNREKDYIRGIYNKSKEEMGNLASLYTIIEKEPASSPIPTLPANNIKKSLSVTNGVKARPEDDQENPWEHKIGSHEITIVFYVCYLLSILADFVLFDRISWRPRTNLRFLSSIPITFGVLLLSLVAYVFI